MNEHSLSERVTRLETQMAEVKSDVGEVRKQLSRTATKDDLEGLKEYFSERDRQYSDRLWWITKALVILFGGAVVAAFGIEKIPELWR